LKINPNAHFGREKYQKWLTEYVIAQKKDGLLKLPLAEAELHPDAQGNRVRFTFADFLKLPHASTMEARAQDQAEVTAAVKAVQGMMKFAKYDSPVLLEALGVLLAHRKYDNPHDAKQLAARAFLKASYEVPEGPSRVAYRQMATAALSMQTRPSGAHHSDGARGEMVLAEIEAEFKKELEEGRTWYAELRERELSWIRDGQDPEVEFDKLYETEPVVSGMEEPPPPGKQLKWALIGLGVLFAVVLLAGVIGGCFVHRAALRRRGVA
jgi:hypothetical protein